MANKNIELEIKDSNKLADWYNNYLKSCNRKAEFSKLERLKED